MKKLLNSLFVMGLIMGSMVNSVSAEHKVSKIDIEKTVVLDGGNLTPKEEFTFVMVPADVEEGTTLNYLDVKEGIGLGDNEVSISYNTNDDLTKTASFDLSGLVFDKEASIYRYHIYENTGSTVSMTYDDCVYVVDLYVTNEGSIEQAVVKDSETNTKKPVEFKNTYETESLTVSKEVEGIFSDINKDFTFRLTLNETSTLPNGTQLEVVKTKNNGDSETLTFTVGQENIFTLKHNESIYVEDLPEGLTYSVSEDQTDGYNVSMSDSDEGVMDDNGASVTFVNTKIDTVDTGVMLDVLPYALSLTLAGFGYVILAVLKKKSEI